MELDDLKQWWKESPVPKGPGTNIMQFIQHKSYGPLAALKKAYRRKMRAMTVVPLLLLMINAEDVNRILTSVLFWSYVLFCLGVILFARYNIRIVKNMQAMDTDVKASLEQQIALLEKRAILEKYGIRAALLFFILLFEVLPFFQHYRMLDKWHVLSPWVRLGAYSGLLLLQYILTRWVKERRQGKHLSYLKELVGQMQ